MIPGEHPTVERGDQFCCNEDCDRPGTVWVGDLTTLGSWACDVCAMYLIELDDDV